MSEFDLHSNIDERLAMSSTIVSTDDTFPGEIIDTKGFESIEFISRLEQFVDGDFVILLDEDDDASMPVETTTTVTSDETLGELPAYNLNSGMDALARVGSIGKKRYQRISIVATNTQSGGQFSAIAILGNPHTGPVPQTLPNLI